MSSDSTPDRRPFTRDDVTRIVEAVRPVREALNRTIVFETYDEVTRKLWEVVVSTPASQCYPSAPPVFEGLPEVLQKPMRDVAHLVMGGRITRPWHGDPIERDAVAAKLDALLGAWNSVQCEELRGAVAENPAGGRDSTTKDATHGVGFRSVKWFGTVHEFTTTQAACVKVLWEQWEQGTPAIAELDLLEAAGSCSSRLRDIFDKGKHTAWGTMIAESRKGAFRLQEPTGEKS